MGFWNDAKTAREGRWHDGPGGQALAALYHTGIVEADWAVLQPEGFEWWPGPLAQRVTLTPEQTLDGLRVSRILVEADVSSGALPDSPDARQRIDFLNQHASLSALTAGDEGALVLAASLLVHEKNMAWTRRILPPLLALQAAEAAGMAESLAQLGMPPAESAHPGSGPRETSAVQLAELVRLVLAREAAPELDPRIFADIAATLKDFGLTARADAQGLDVELPFAGETALLQLLGPMQHPGLGHGVLCLLVLPVLSLRHALSAEGPAGLLARLNAQARSPSFHADSLPALGGWAPDPNSGHPALAAFVPAPLAADEVLTDLAMAQLARALLLARCFDDAAADGTALARSIEAAV